MTTTMPIPDLAARAERRDAHKSAVRDMFDRIAPTYDRLNRVLSGGLDAAWRARAIAAVSKMGEPPVPPGASLDLCAGTLDLTVLLERARPHERLIAADFSEPMLRRGHPKVPRAEIVVADAESLPFADASIAVVVNGFGMRNVGDTERAIREVCRVLVPHGVFVTLEFFRPTVWGKRLLHTTVTSHLLPAVGGLLSGDAGAYAYLAKSMESFLSRAEYQRALEQAGFQRVGGEDLTLGVASIVRGVKRA